MEFRVTYQKTPYNYTSPAVLVIEAASKEEAFATAWDHLTRKGMSVETCPCKGVARDAVEALGVPVSSPHGDTVIRTVEPHAVTVRGIVKAEVKR